MFQRIALAAGALALALAEPVHREVLDVERAVEEIRRDNDGANPTPVVLWHGMGDDCCHVFSMGSIKRLIEQQIPGVYVLSLCIGDNPDDVTQCNQVSDTLNGFLGNANDQVQYACDVVSQDPELANGFHIVGFSQGGLFSRALAERCANAQIKSLVSIGGPQQGVEALPNCDNNGSKEMCEYITLLLDQGAYLPNIQNHLIQAQYWHDSLHYEDYLSKNIFLPGINQENGVNEDEVNQFLTIEDLVLVKFNNDTVVNPTESEWFGFYEENTDHGLVPAQQLPVWENLKLDLLDSQGKLTFLATDGDHLQFTDTWFIDNIIPFLEK